MHERTTDCLQVFSALDRAERKLGFCHADLGAGLGCHVTRGCGVGQRIGLAGSSPWRASWTGLPGYMLSAFRLPLLCPAPTGAGMRNIMEHYCATWEELPGGAAAATHVPRIPGYTCNANGSRLPLGPEVEVRMPAPSCRAVVRCSAAQHSTRPRSTHG